MKKSNRTVRKMRSAWTGFAAACLAAALTMSALVSCAPQESRPVVTSDDLTPPSAAQEAIAQEAGGGKNYAYYWQEETLQMLREADEQEVNDAKELIAKGEEAVKAAGYPSLAEAQQAVEARQARIEQDLADNQKRLEAELALDPVVSAQEAANLAGSLFEKLYGFDLSQDTLLRTAFCSAPTPSAARWMRRPASLSPWIIRLAVKKSRPCRRRRFRPALSKGQTPTLRAAMAIGMKPKRAMPGQWRS